MLSIMTGIILIINLLVLLPLVIKSIKRFPIKKIFEKNDASFNKNFDDKPKYIKVIAFCIFLPIAFVFILLIFSFSLMPIWLPALLWIFVTWQAALFGFAFSMMLSTLIADLLLIYENKKKEIPNFKLILINDWLLVCSLTLSVLFIVFNFNLNIDQNIQFIIQKIWFLPLFISVIYPVLLLALISTNIYLLIVKASNAIRKITTFNSTNLLLIFTASCFIGIVYINNMNISYLNADQTAMLYRNVGIVQVIMTAVLIPVIIRKLFDKKIK